MEGATQNSVFTPAGGANQDDSIVTPVTNGSSPFQDGDYRYALNLRIGSSHDDSFGDGENILSTKAFTDYYTYSTINSNPDFTGSLTGWSQTANGGNINWIFFPNVARIIYSGVFQSYVIYQAISSSNKTITVKYSCGASSGLFTSGLLSLVFLNNTTELESVVLEEIFPSNAPLLKATKTISVPDNCNGVGIRLSGTATLLYFDVNYFYINGFSLGSMPVGTNKVIGKYEDTEFQRIYEAVYNSNGDHTIRWFDPAQSITFELLKWSGLKFQSNYFVKMAKLDNWLSFTDRNNAPRLIDTNSISELFNVLGNTNFREFHISLHKWAPTIPPIPRVYYDGVTNNFQKLKNKIYQYAYRYVYYGNLKSRWSPISKGAITTVCGYYYTPTGSPNVVSQLITSIEVDIPGGIYDDPNSSAQYNYFDHSDIKFTSAVNYIELAFREGELDIWKQWKTIDVSKGVPNRYQYFDGSANLTPLSEDDFGQLFDTVPLKAGTIEAVDNRFVLADIIEEEEPAPGFSVTSLNVVTDPINDWRESFHGSFPTLSPTFRDDIVRRNSLSDFNFKDGGTYKLGIQWLAKTGWRSALYTNDTWVYNTIDNNIGTTNRLLAFNFFLNLTPPKWAVGYQIFRTNVLNFDYFLYGIVNQFSPLIDDVSDILDKVNLPKDIRDRVRQHFENTRLITGDDVISEIDHEVQVAINVDNSKNKNNNNILKLNENLTKPSLPLTGGVNLFVQKKITKYLKSNPISDKLIPELRKTKAISLIDVASRIYIDINNWYFGSKYGADKENPLNKLYYNFRTGDRVRFTGADVTTPIYSDLKEYDVEIIEFTGKGIIIEKPATLKWIQRSGNADGSYYYGIEVYTPKVPTTVDHLMFEVGEWYPVLYPGTINRTLSKKDFVYTNNSAVTAVAYGPFNIFNKIPFFYADCYNIPKLIYRDSTIENIGSARFANINISMNPDPDKVAGYWDRCNGRVALPYSNIPVAAFKTTMARFSNKIVEQSFVNAINNFTDENQFIYPSEYGRIRNLINTSNAQVESVGSIVLAIGEREAWSIYVNRTTLEDLSGRSQVSLSDQVLGSYNTLLGSHGTMNPESVSKYRGNVYWWDVLNGSWIRYGRDGLTAISDYKKRNWFKEISNLLLPFYLTNEKPVAISEFDPFNMELVTYMDHSLLPSTFRGYAEYKGDTFSERDTRWKTNHSYTPELFAKMNNQLYSFKDGIIYQHEAGTDYNMFYGEKVDVKIEPVFNDGFMNVKSWQTIALISTHPWMAERILSEFRGDKTIQLSNIPLDTFEDLEDIYSAPILNDENTPNTSLPLYEGQKMRSKAIRVLLTLDPSVTTKALLHYVVAGYIDSPKKQLNS